MVKLSANSSTLQVCETFLIVYIVEVDDMFQIYSMNDMVLPTWISTAKAEQQQSSQNLILI